MLLKCAATSLSSKLVAHQKDFFSKMVVDAVMSLDELLPLNMIGIKKITGGALEVGTECLLFESFMATLKQNVAVRILVCISLK